MKTLRNMVVAALLTGIFAVSASAGDMWAGITNPPPPPPTGAVAEGDMHAGITESVLTILEGVLSMF